MVHTVRHDSPNHESRNRYEVLADIEDEREVKDYWYDADPRSLSSAWTGSTLFLVIKTQATTRLYLGGGQAYTHTKNYTTRISSTRTLEHHGEARAAS